jgi:cytochrome b561
MNDIAEAAHAQPLARSVERYGPRAIAFHWVMFVLVVAVGVLGLLHDSWPHDSQAFWINVHAVCGLILWALLLVRFGWRMQHRPPSVECGRAEVVQTRPSAAARIRKL